jgi:hypothetical protein
MDPNSAFGELIEKGQNAAANTVQTAAKNTASDVVSTVKGQITGKNEVTAGKPQVQSQTQVSPQGPTPEPAQQVPLENGDFAKEMVSDFYSPSPQTSQAALESQEQQQTDEKLVRVRQELFQQQHNEVYYNEIANAGAPKEPEERPADKVERQKMEDLQQKEDKKAPLVAVRMAQTTTEINRGVGG